jgi:hypothetical protein
MLGKEDVCDVRRRSVVCSRQASRRSRKRGASRAREDVYRILYYILYILYPFDYLIHI